MEGFGDISGLNTLLQESRDAESSVSKASSLQQTQKPMATGATVVKLGGHSTVQNPTKDTELTKDSIHSQTGKGEKNKSIWEIIDVPTEDMLACGMGDDRPCPRYEISYKQAVGTEDTFLGLGGKDPSSASCTHITIKIHFPGSSMKDLELDVTTNRIKAESKTHRLFTYLPVSVDKDKGSAKFDKDKDVLVVTLPIIED